MSGRVLIIAMVICTLSGCGGGSPFVGFWQCESNPASSLEIARFEHYFLVTARHASQEIVRDGIFANDVFSVGANSVGQAMQLSLIDDKLTCTKPPNFCHCESAFGRVESLTSASRAAPEFNKASEDELRPHTTLSGPAPKLLRKRPPTLLQLDNGGQIALFDDYRNEDIEQRMFDWPKLTYYYLPELHFWERSEQGIAALRQHGEQVFVVFSLAVTKPDRFELMERVHAAINQKIRPENVHALSPEKIVVALPGHEQAEVLIDPILLTGEVGVPREIAIPIVAQEKSAAVAAARSIMHTINSGLSLPRVSFEVETTEASAETTQPLVQKVMHEWRLVH